VLRQNLELTRQALDKFFSDNGKYPDNLEDLVNKKYLRSIPYDPIAESSTSWLIISSDTPEKGAVYDIKSGASGQGLDGTEYKDW
jgi:general secretion pathway protein G